MNAPTKGRHGAALALAVALAAAPALAAEVGLIPVVADAGVVVPVTFVNGGVSKEEAEAMRSAAPHYALEITFTRRGEGGRSEFVAEAGLRIVDANGDQVVSLADQGPIFLAQLPDGRYTIEAQYAGKQQVRKVDIRNGRHQAVSFYWG